MIFTEHLRTFTSVNFWLSLAGNTITYVTVSMVRSPISTLPPNITVSTHRLLLSVLTFAGVHVLILHNPQSSPVLGICFCLIIVRLGKVLPVAQEETWHASIRTPSSRTPGSGRFSVSFPKVEVRRGVYVSDSGGFPMEALESQKGEYVDSSNGSPKVFRSSVSLPTPK